MGRLAARGARIPSEARALSVLGAPSAQRRCRRLPLACYGPHSGARLWPRGPAKGARPSAGKRGRSRRYTWQRQGFASAASHKLWRATSWAKRSAAASAPARTCFRQSPQSVNVFTDCGDPLCGTRSVAVTGQPKGALRATPGLCSAGRALGTHCVTCLQGGPSARSRCFREDAGPHRLRARGLALMIGPMAVPASYLAPLRPSLPVTAPSGCLAPVRRSLL